MVRGLGPHRRYSAGPYPAATRGGDENAPPDGFYAAPFTSTSGTTVPGAATRHPFPSRIRPPLASSSSLYNRKPQLPQFPAPAPTPKKVSGVRTVGNTPARTRVARTSLELTKKPSLSLGTRSVDVPLFKVKESISFWEREANCKVQNSSSKCIPITPANLEACSDESFMRDTESKLSLELEWDILKTIFVEEFKSHAEVEGRTAALEDELKAANFRIHEACRHKEAIQAELNVTRETLESNLLDLIQESNKSLELLQERDMEIQRLNCELEKANFNRKYQQDHVSCSSAEQEKNDFSRQAEVQTELIRYLATEQSSIQLQLETRKNNELLAKQNLGQIEFLLDEAIKIIVQKEVLTQNYASLLESQQEQSKSYYEGRLKELEITLQEMNDQVVASLISRNKEIWKIHAEEKNEILKKNKMLEISIEDFNDTVYSLEEKANKFEEEAQKQRRQREKLEVELHNLRQQSLVAPSSGKAESSLKDGMTDLADSTRVLSNRNNELLCSQESWRICRMEVADKESMVTEQLEGEMAQQHLSYGEYQSESSQFEHPSPAELYSNGADSDLAPSESESREQGPPEALKPIIEVVEEKELPPAAPVQDRKPLDYALAPSDELKRLRTINHYEGQRTATDRRFWSIEQQDLYTSIYKSSKIFEMKWIDWEHIQSVDQFAGIRERCASLGLEQIMSYAYAWDAELIRQFYATVHISTDKSSITWMTNGRKITTNKRAWEETFGIPAGVHTEIHSQFWIDDDDKRILYTAAEPSQISGLNPLTIIAKKIAWSTIYPRSGNNIVGHDWNLLYHIVKQEPFDIIALLFGEIDLIISGRNGTKGMLLYAPYIMGTIMRAFEYDGPRESMHNSYKPRPSYSYKQKRRNRCSCTPAPAAAAPFEPPPSPSQPEIVVDVDADNQQQFDAAEHQLQVEAVHGEAELTVTQTDLQVVEDRLRPIMHSLTDVSAQPAVVRPSPFRRFPWYQREK